MAATRRMKARKDSDCPECDQLIRVGTMILKFADDKYWVCQRCALLRSQSAPPGIPLAAASWADGMYAELGVTLGDAVHRALVPVLHPDAGGDHAAMSVLNRARDRAHGKNSREAS